MKHRSFSREGDVFFILNFFYKKTTYLCAGFTKICKQKSMYLSPLNYDRYFKKVFSDINIAKAFLMDFLDVEIETIEPLSSTHKLTDNATNVAFDFRCKIDGQYVIIDMQQWYKTDVVKRFYVYHAANSVLQLETLPFKKLLENVVEEDKQ